MLPPHVASSVGQYLNIKLAIWAGYFFFFCILEMEFNSTVEFDPKLHDCIVALFYYDSRASKKAFLCKHKPYNGLFRSSWVVIKRGPKNWYDVCSHLLGQTPMVESDPKSPKISPAQLRRADIFFEFV